MAAPSVDIHHHLILFTCHLLYFLFFLLIQTWFRSRPFSLTLTKCLHPTRRQSIISQTFPLDVCRLIKFDVDATLFPVFRRKLRTLKWVNKTSSTIIENALQESLKQISNVEFIKLLEKNKAEREKNNNCEAVLAQVFIFIFLNVSISKINLL